MAHHRLEMGVLELTEASLVSLALKPLGQRHYSFNYHQLFIFYACKIFILLFKATIIFNNSPIKQAEIRSEIAICLEAVVDVTYRLMGMPMPHRSSEAA
ncbi:hypothetical protein TKK_0007737 [Trichogramma kaykai]